METEVVKGKKIAAQYLDLLKVRIGTEIVKPRLDIIQVGDDYASSKYVDMKKSVGSSIGIDVVVHKFDATYSQDDLVDLITKLNSDSRTSGVMVQLPLPDSIDTKYVLDQIAPSKDVDGLTSITMDNLQKGADSYFLPATVRAVVETLKDMKVDLMNMNTVIVGMGPVVGLPLSYILKPKVKMLSTCDESTPDIKEYTMVADLIISATGHPHLIDSSHIKPGAVLVDVGFEIGENGEPIGDINTEDIMGKASAIVPSPGGIGPVTVAMLMQNTYEAFLRNGK